MGHCSNKTKMRYIIKAYLLLKGEASANELCQFLQDNYKWHKPLTSRAVAGVLQGHGTHHNDVLYGLKKRYENSTHIPTRYYLDGDKK